MKPFIVYETYKLKKSEIYDFFIYAPHDWVDQSWLDIIKQNLRENDFEDKIIMDYIIHESDLGSWIISKGIFEYIKTRFPELKLCLIIWQVPRAFCDFNRSIENACPKILKTDYFLDMYKDSISQIEKIVENSACWIHIHTMCWRENDFPWNFHENIKNNDLIEFLEKSYSWEERRENFLTSNKAWDYYSCKMLDRELRWVFDNAGIPFYENKSYSLENKYLVTNLIQKVPSSFIEVLKSNIATDETKDFTNNSKIVLDEVKVQKYINLLNNVIENFLIKKYY